MSTLTAPVTLAELESVLGAPAAAEVETLAELEPLPKAQMRAIQKATAYAYAIQEGGDVWEDPDAWLDMLSLLPTAELIARAGELSGYCAVSDALAQTLEGYVEEVDTLRAEVAALKAQLLVAQELPPLPAGETVDIRTRRTLN